jgi:hypothetical protein
MSETSCFGPMRFEGGGVARSVGARVVAPALTCNSSSRFRQVAKSLVIFIFVRGIKNKPALRSGNGTW